MRTTSYLCKNMKSHLAFFVIFSLLLVVNLSYARKDMGDYWKNMMNGQAMPEAIKDLLAQDPQESDAAKDHFVRDFDIRPNLILYHTHAVSRDQKQHAMAEKIEQLQGTGTHG